jgi:hypothetical protein
MSKFAGLSLPVDTTAKMMILHPLTQQPLADKNGNEAFIELFSKDSQRARAFNRNATQRKLDMRGRATVSVVSIENENFGLAAELTKGWMLVDLAGQVIDVDCTTVNARELYADPSMTWLYEQVDAFTGARGNFSKPSAIS